MKKKIGKILLLLIVLATILLPLLCGGCNGVILSAQYAQELDYTAALAAETAARAQQDKLTADEMKSALSRQAVTWQKFKNAKDGVK